MSLYESLQEKMEGRRYNGYFHACCPFPHNGRLEEHPSFFVYEDGRFRCASCLKTGTLNYLHKYLGGNDTKMRKPARPQVLPRWKLWEEKYGDLTGIAKYAHQSCKRYPQFMWYFKERKIDQFFDLGFFGMIDNWALFPVFDVNHKIQNIVVRHTIKKDTRYAIKHVEDSQPLLYVPNWRRVQGSDTIYVPFGIVDSWAFEACELASVTGITGKSLSADLLKALGKRIVLVPDEYEEKEAHQIANKLGWRARVKRLVYPEGAKDPDGLRINFGSDFLLQAVGA